MLFDLPLEIFFHQVSAGVVLGLNSVCFFHQVPRPNPIPSDSPGFPKAPRCSLGLLGSPQGSTGLPRAPWCSLVLPGAPQGSPEFPRAPRRSLGSLGLRDDPPNIEVLGAPK